MTDRLNGTLVAGGLTTAGLDGTVARGLSKESGVSSSSSTSMTYRRYSVVLELASKHTSAGFGTVWDLGPVLLPWGMVR